MRMFERKSRRNFRTHIPLPAATPGTNKHRISRRQPHQHPGLISNGLLPKQKRKRMLGNGTSSNAPWVAQGTTTLIVLESLAATAAVLENMAGTCLVTEGLGATSLTVENLT
jgi:hypothetical protein